jgi:hypothetical protein
MRALRRQAGPLKLEFWSLPYLSAFICRIQGAKDLLRAAHLPLLPCDDPHVDDDLKRIHKGKSLRNPLRWLDELVVDTNQS